MRKQLVTIAYLLLYKHPYFFKLSAPEGVRGEKGFADLIIVSVNGGSVTFQPRALPWAFLRNQAISV